MKQYVNFHAHSMGSLLDGMSKFDNYAERAKELGMPAFSFTDHGNLHGLLPAYEAAEKVGLKYFPGIEAYCARKTRFDRDEEERAGRETAEWQQRGPYHLGLIAYNNTGYQNLLKLSSRAFLEGFYVKGRIDHDLLSEHSEGLVVLSGCLSGEIQQAFLRGDDAFAFDTAYKLQSIVGKENFFIELQNHFIEEELQNHEKLILLAKTIGAPIVATCDSHYTCKDHAYPHDLLLCVNTRSKVDTPDRFKFSGDHFYLKSYEEMAELFPEEYLDNTMLIYEKHDLKLEFDKYHIPNFPAPVGITQEQLFIQNVYAGAQKRFGSDWRSDQAIVERVEYEIQVIVEMGFPNYFLIVSDIMQYAHNRGIMCGAGRGSAAGSIVSFCLDITQLNPLDYDLPFERFLVPGRKSLPDIDLDVDDRFRDEIIEYTRQKYGYDHTSQICTFSEIGAKSAIKDVARVLNYGFEIPTKINDAMPPALFGVTKTLDECLQTEEFYKLYSGDEDARKIIDLAKQFEGLWRQSGVHAAGLVLADKPVIEYIPVMQKGEGTPVVTQWDMFRVDQCKLLKIDFLGLRNLSMVDIAFKLIRERHGKDYQNRYDLVKEEDPAVFELLGRGDNNTLFQLESLGMRKLMIAMKPSSINDVAALLALYRPGPMGSNVHNEYVERKHGRKPVLFLHPQLEPILKPTYGLLLYQEQLLKIAREIAGFSVGEADNLRKVVGKKKPEEMAKMRSQFVNGCIKTSNWTMHLATTLFNEIEHHASYSFSANHSYAYAYTSYLTAWLKHYYPVEALTAALSSVSGNADRTRLYLNECHDMGIKVLTPSVNDSKNDFHILDDNTIIFGFNSMKGIGETASAILAKANNQYESLHDFLRRVDPVLMSRDMILHFINAGAFDALINKLELPLESLNRLDKHHILFNEMNELGVFITDHPLSDSQDLLYGKANYTLEELYQLPDKSDVRVAGVVLDITKKMTRAGKRMYTIILNDLGTSLSVSVMPKLAESLPDPPFEKGTLVIVEGRLSRSIDDEHAAIEIMCFNLNVIDPNDLNTEEPIILNAGKDPNLFPLEKILDIIDENPGSVPVYVLISDGKTDRFFKIPINTTRTIEERLLQVIEEN